MVFEALPAEARRAPLTPLLADPIRSVRLQAAWLLAPASAAFAGTAGETAFARAAEEFIASRRYRADRPEDRTSLGFFLAQLGRRAEAIAEYRAAPLAAIYAGVREPERSAAAGGDGTRG
jgi:hypothetical protein